MSESPTVAVFRPDDGRLDTAINIIESLGGEPLADPMLAVNPTGEHPRTDADVIILTSKTGAELASEAGWDPGTATVCAIGETTADALRTAGYSVDVVPTEFSSAGLVNRLKGEIAGARVEVARSDHGSSVLIEGLEAAGAYIHETVLYRLNRPARSGKSVEAAAAGEIDGALFTSSLTVEHFLALADDRGLREDAVAGLHNAVVGAIGKPTADTAESAGITVDVLPDKASFEALARASLSYRPDV